MSDTTVEVPPPVEYVPEPPPPVEPWPEDHVPAEPLTPVEPPAEVVPEEPEPIIDEQLYDIWQGTNSTPINWTKMTGAENQGLTYEAVTHRCMTLEGFTPGASVPYGYISHHIGVKQGEQPPTPA